MWQKLQDNSLISNLIMPSTLKKMVGHIAFGFCVCASVTLFFYASCNIGTVHTRVLKFHIWIPHEKIADPYFFFSELCFFLELFLF